MATDLLEVLISNNENFFCSLEDAEKALGLKLEPAEHTYSGTLMDGGPAHINSSVTLPVPYRGSLMHVDCYGWQLHLWVGLTQKCSSCGSGIIHTSTCKELQ